MKSMTGYGRGESDNGKLKVVVEIKSVNHRYSEIQVKQPRNFLSFEEPIKKHISRVLDRGRIEVFVRTLELEPVTKTIQIDHKRAFFYHEQLKDLAQSVNESYVFDGYQLIRLPEVVIEQELEEDLKEIWVVVQLALSQAVDSLLIMRKQEGNTIKQDLIEKIERIQWFTDQVEQRSPLVLVEYKQRLQTRIQELLENNLINEERLAQEVVYFAEKSCIDEELVRLRSHFSQFFSIIEEENSIGRKLDFLIQEMNRETNTIGSKANDLEIGKHVVEMKSELEKLREQVQNIE